MDNWKSLYIYFISGTGNARISSEWIAEEARKRGLKTVVQQIDRLENIVMPSADEKPLIGFAFPTHGFNAAPIMLRFVASFPPGLCKEVFLLNTRAGMKLYKLFMPGLSGVALLLPAFILRLKKYKCIGFRSVDLPSNWIPLHPGLRIKVIESIFIRCEKIVRNFANKILSGEKVYSGLFSLPVDLIISPVAFGYYVAGRYFLSKTFVANYKCNNCGLCIKECPTSSIKLVGGRPYWKLSCESCMRCLNHCPKRAIEAAHGMAVVFWIIFTTVNTQIILLLINVLNIQPKVWWWRITADILSIGGMILIVTLLYRIMHYIIGLKPVNYLVRFTSLTALPFWRRYTYLKNNKKYICYNKEVTTF
ncbi:MAG: EFR1 family ferrodoxin [Bacteroidales bacterium]|nr:EFR1 family ferrodoxin [Bacteroidales bacterium]